MGFITSRRYGKYWEDAKTLHQLIHDHTFFTTASNERGFESELGSAIKTREKEFESEVITQKHRASAVQSVYCFGKNHRPDMTLGESGVAIEVKHVTYAGLRDAIGQGYIYRLRYRFVFLVLVVSHERRTIYKDLDLNKEKDLADVLQDLADTMNVFTYVVPAFKPERGMKKCISFFEPIDLQAA